MNQTMISFPNNKITTVLLDFGGVIAEEGFLEGLRAIARTNNLDPDSFFTSVDALIYETGYLTGKTDEASFWNFVRTGTGVRGGDRELRDEILNRFVLRPEMIAATDALRSRGIVVAMLSDQTNWLDEINEATSLFHHFDRVFNSYHIHKSKRDASVFFEVCSVLGVLPGEVLFVDDNPNHIKRAEGQGLHTIHFVGVDDFLERLERTVEWQPTAQQ